MAATDVDGQFDTIFKALGWRGKYQSVQICLLFILNFPLAFSVMSIIFIGYHAESRCMEPKNTSVFIDHGFDLNVTDANITYKECQIIITSNQSGEAQLSCVAGFEYLQPQKLSLASEWDLVCGKESLVDLLQTFHMLGNGIGSIVFTILGDKGGRKFAHVLGGISLLLVASSMAFVPSYTPFAILKIIQGACQMGAGLTGVALNLEIVPTEHRSKMGIFGTLVWALCVVFYAVAAYLMRSISWRYHQLVVGITACYFLLLPCLLDESCRWLKSMKRYDAIERILRKAARTNGKDEEDIIAMFKQKIAVSDAHENSHPLITKSVNYENGDRDADSPLAERKQPSTEKSPFLQIFKDKQILSVSAVTWFMWLTNSVTYYGLSLTSTEFHSNKYLGFGLNACMEVIGAIAFWLVVDRFGRKNSSLGFHLLAGGALILSVVFGTFTDTIPSFSAAVTTLSLIGKFAITVSFNILWLYTPELFPTKIRTVGFGLASMSARVGGLFAPFTRTLHHLYPWAPGTIFGSFCLVVALLIRVLPETANCELCQTIQDMKNMISNKGRKMSGTKENDSGKKNDSP